MSKVTNMQVNQTIIKVGKYKIYGFKKRSEQEWSQNKKSMCNIELAIENPN